MERPHGLGWDFGLTIFISYTLIIFCCNVCLLYSSTLQIVCTPVFCSYLSYDSYRFKLQYYNYCDEANSFSFEVMKKR